MGATQLVFDLAPVRTVAVGDRVRVRPTFVRELFTSVAPGMTGTVVDIRARQVPCLNGGYWTCLPIAVAIDGLPHSYAFDDEDLEVTS